jgi:hypothetical protein
MAQTPNVGPLANAKATGFNSFAAGDKTYGAGRSSPNLGPTSNLEGYRERNLTTSTRKNAIMRRLNSKAGSGPIGLK